MDHLTSILQDLRLESSFYARSELHSPWGLAFVEKDGPSFHIILEGSCWLRLGKERILLQAGDLVILPHVGQHQLANPEETPTLFLHELPSERVGDNAVILDFDGLGERAVLVCGGVRFAGPIAHPLVEILPTVLLLSKEEYKITSKWLEPTIQMLESEALSLKSGSAAVMTRLADILVLQTVRAWLEKNLAHQDGWLRGLNDPQIGQALKLIHRQAEKPWTVTSLAQAVYLSRSVFYEKFTKHVGMAPIQYLRRWRMYLAGSWIKDQGISPSEVAIRLGYSSEAAFSRAFKLYIKESPGSLRKSRDEF